jgi:hypothetical protein
MTVAAGSPLRQALRRGRAWDHRAVPLEFRRCDAGRPPASELIDALLDEYDVIAGRELRGGPSAEPSDFAPPGGAFVVGFLDGIPACCGGVKASTFATWPIYAAAGYLAIADYNDNPHADVWAEKALYGA